MTSAREIGKFIDLNFKAQKEMGKGEVLVTLPTTRGRRQNVLITLIDGGNCQIIELRSRCCLAKKATIIRSALRNNLKTQLGGFAMDSSEDQDAIDLMYRAIVLRNGAPNWEELKTAIDYIAAEADRIESKSGKADVF